MKQKMHTSKKTSKHGKWPIIGIAVVIVLLAAGIWAVVSAVKTEEPPEETEQPVQTAENSIEPTENKITSDTAQPEISIQVDAIPEQSDAPAVILPPEQSTNVEMVQEITFPYHVPNTELIVEEVVSYDGIFLEDGSDTEISGVTALILKNNSEYDAEYIDLTMERSGVTLTFQASAIPSGGTVVVQEANQTPYQGGGYANCRASVAYLEKFEHSETEIKVEDMGNSVLKVTNLTQENIPCVRIFYKFYLEEKEAYVGGIAYTAKITDLKAGASIEVSPTHYVSGSSQIMMVRTYSSAED